MCSNPRPGSLQVLVREVSFYPKTETGHLYRSPPKACGRLRTGGSQNVITGGCEMLSVDKTVPLHS